MDINTRRAAAASLASIAQNEPCTREVINVLAHSFSEPHKPEGSVHAAAARALGRIFQNGGNVAGDTINKVAVPALVQILNRPDPDPMVRASAALALGQLRDNSPHQEAVRALIKAIKETHVNVGEAASLSLIRMSQIAIRELQSALTDPNANADFRWKVAWILGQMGPPAKDAVPMLGKALNDNQEDPNVRAAAAWAIGSIGRAAQGTSNFFNIVRSLTDVLHSDDDDANIRSNAAWALGRIGPEVKTDNARFLAVVTTALLHGLRDSDSDIRRNAAWALGQINPNQQIAAPALATALSDPDRRVRLECAAALGQLGTLSTSGRESVMALSSALQDQFLQVRAAAAISLGRLGPEAEQALRPLTAIMIKPGKLGDEERYVSRSAIEAAVKIAYALDVEQRMEATDTLKEVADKIQSTGDSEHATKIMNVVYKLNSMRWFNKVSGTLAWVQRYRVLILAACAYILFWFFIYWRYPFFVFRLNETMKPYLGYRLPKFMGGIPLSYLVLGEFFHYSPRVLDAWVAHNLQCVRENFKGKATVKQRSVYVDLPVFVDNTPVSHLRATDLRPCFEKKRTCILICGEGGAGKTSLACEICNWAMSDHNQLANHPLLGVLLEQEDLGSFRGDGVLTDAVRSQLWFLLDSETAPSAELIEHLLRRRRILVVVDGLSEMSEAIRSEVQPGHPQFSARALIIASRLEETPPGVGTTTIRPMRISRDHLATFMEAYLVQCGKRALFNQTEYFEDLTKLSRMAGEREITVLLAKLYAEQMIAVKETSQTTLPENVPELMLKYLNELNWKVKTNRLEDRMVHKVAKLVAWYCLEQTFRPVPTRIAKIIDQLGSQEYLIRYLEDALRLVQTVGAGRDQIRFTLDPLAEYLAAMYKLEGLTHDEDGWRDLLARTHDAPGESEAIRGFLLALYDCCLTQGAEMGVPPFVVKELSNRVHDKSRFRPPQPEVKPEQKASTAA